MSSSLRRRDKYKIIFAILKICKKPTSKTQIMYRANLSFDQLKRYLKFLKEKELIVEESQWKTTEKGLKYIEIFKKLQSLLK